MDQLTLDCIAAQKAGMTYGKWKAQQPVVTPVVEPEPWEVQEDSTKICRNCGTKLPKNLHANARYCSRSCKDEIHSRYSLAYYYRKKGMESDGKV